MVLVSASAGTDPDDTTTALSVQAFFEAAHTLWEVSTEDGKELYGEQYKDIHYFSGYHLSMAAQKSCDHMHEGLGFLTQVRCAVGG